MAYAQINYSEKVGNGPYTIAQIGCLDTAFCNLAEQEFNVNVDPATLNAFFISHNDYLADPEDGAGVKDDLSWSSITAFDSAIVISSSHAGAGWPNTNKAIVKFAYVKNGVNETHFCKVANYETQSIVDSYDGVTKTPAQYESVYGQPVAYAIYEGPAVQAVQTVANPPAPAAPATQAPAAGETIHLAADNNPFHAYKPGGPYNPNNAADYKGMINPKAFGGLNYAVVASLGNGIYRINSQDYGQVDIWTSGSDVSVSGGGHGAGESTAAAGDFEVKLDSPETNDDEKVPVKVGNWQDTYQPFMNPQRYVVNKDVTIEDVNDDDDKPLPDQPLVKGTLFEDDNMIVGSFSRDGVKYYRSNKSVANGTWYGVPVTDLTKVGSDEDLAQILDSIQQDESGATVAAHSTGHFFSKLHKNKKG